MMIMNRNRLVKIAILTGILVLSACSNNGNGVGSTEAQIEEMEILVDSVVLENVEELTEMATHIIRGEVLDQRVEWVDPSVPREVIVELLIDQGMTQEEIDFELYGVNFEIEPRLMTIYRIQILEIFQGNHQIGDVIEVSQLGGEYENEQWFIADAIELSIGDEFILFLYSHEDIGFPYVLINHNQGAYYVPNGIELEESLMEIDDREVELENASETDPIMLTIEDLIEIAIDNDLLNE